MSSIPSASLAALRARHGARYRWYVLLTVMLGTIASVMASTIVNVAVPDMSRHFTLGPAHAQWLSAGFIAAMTVSMPVTPWLLERHGYRRAYSGAIVLLLLGSVAGGLSNSYALVLSMRVAEGLAAGVLQPIPAIIILRAFAPDEQGRAMGIFGAAVVLAPALGPSIGGVLVEWFGWRSIFFVAAPFCALALPLAWMLLPHSAPGGGEVNAQGAKLDLAGLMLAGVGILLLLNGLAQLHGPTAWIGALLLVAGGVVAVVFVPHQRRKPQPLIRLDLFHHRSYAYGGLVSFIYGAALFGSTYLLPVFMQDALHLSPSRAGAVLLPAGIVLAITIPLVGRWAVPGARRMLIAAGLGLLALSFAMTPWVGPATALWLLAALAVLGRIGLGCILPSLSLAALEGVPPALLAQGTSLISLLRQLGGAAGISLVGVTLKWRLDALGPAGVLRAHHETFVLLGALTAVAIVAAWRIQPHREGPHQAD